LTGALPVFFLRQNWFVIPPARKWQAFLVFCISHALKKLTIDLKTKFT